MSQFPVSLGFKLSLGWQEQQRLGLLPSFDGDLYVFLCRNGFDYFEFGAGACSDEGEIALLRQEAVACADGGLGVALHPYLAGAANPASFGESSESLTALESVLRAAAVAADVCGRRVPVVLHPAECSYEGDEIGGALFRSQLLRRSRLFFSEVAKRATASHESVEPLVEHQVPPSPGERTMRIGDTYAELLEVVAGSGLGICWDTGHYLLSVQRHGQEETPPDEFLWRVGHVHLHDVVAGRDHCVIAPTSRWLRDHMRMLQQRGFSGGVTLEYSADAIQSVGTFERLVGDSVEALSSWAL